MLLCASDGRMAHALNANETMHRYFTVKSALAFYTKNGFAR